MPPPLCLHFISNDNTYYSKSQTEEVADWLTARGLTIERMLGDYEGHPYTDSALRAIFWARKEGVDYERAEAFR